MAPVQQQQQQRQQHHVSLVVSKSAQDMIAPRQLAPPLFQDATTLPNQNSLQGSAQVSSSIISPKQQGRHISLPPQQPQIMVPPERRLSADASTGTEQAAPVTQQGIINEISEANTEEIRKLEQEFEKKMQRAKKSYGTRMDNLHRSKDEAEAIHQATLQKHEKERTEFEKRVRLAEEEQTRRLNQIEKEFIEKKEGVRQQHGDKVGAAVQRPPLAAMRSEGGGGVLPPLHEGHKRSSSHFDLSSKTEQHQSSPFKDHKRNSSDPDIHGEGGGVQAGADNSAPASLSSSQSALSDGGPQQQQPPLATLRPSGIPPMPSSGEVKCRPHQTGFPLNLPNAVRSSGQGGHKQAAIAGNVASSSNSGASTSALRDRSESVSS